MKVYAIHENPEWFPPFAAAFEEEGVPYEEWLLDVGSLDLDARPPEGIFWSRMSASSHTRGHILSKDHTRAVLAWLQAHGRRTVNGRRVLELEMSKVDQLTALRAGGIDVPRTVAVFGRERLLEQARGFPTPFLSKPNQGGKGLGVHRFDSVADFAAYAEGPDFDEPVDGITLLQEYVEPAGGFITRVEIVGGAYLYALKASTSQGFELCPADACAVPFELRKDFDSPLIPAYLSFAERHGIEIAGFEFLEAADGRIVTYDVNTNTNYNPTVEAQAERSGPQEIARFLNRLRRERPSAA